MQNPNMIGENWMAEFDLSAEDLAWVNSRWPHHIADGMRSIDEYVRAHCVALAESVTQRRRVYLDTCFWIRLRDVEMKRANSVADSQLLAALRSRVGDGSLVCPVSAATFVELHKQSDNATREAMAALIDELSTGVALQMEQTRMSTELARLLYLRNHRVVEDRATLAWAPISIVLGEQHPVSEALPPAIQLAVQKSFFDLMSRIPLRAVTRALGRMPRDAEQAKRAASELHNANMRHAGEHATFEGLRMAELDGALELFVDDAGFVLDHLVSGAARRPAAPPDSTRIPGQVVMGVLRALSRTPEFASECPSIYVSATCYAAVRWDRHRVFRANDSMDFHHASAALPYCDAFFTETPLRVLLQQRHTRLSTLFPCAVMDDAFEALEWLSSQSRASSP